jgi:hypothetical protein
MNRAKVGDLSACGRYMLGERDFRETRWKLPGFAML